MRPQYPEEKIGIVTIFPGGAARETLSRVMDDRWKIKTVKGYVDPDGKLFAAYGIRGVPFSVLFDANGKQVASFEGFPGKGAIVEKFNSVLKK